MEPYEVLIAKLKPDDPEADRLLDRYEAETQSASHFAEGHARTYYVEASSMGAAKDRVREVLHRVGGDTWHEHLTLARGDDAAPGF